MSRSLTALAVCIMLILPVAPVLGGSQWNEGPTAFKSGTRTNTNVITDHLQLGNITPSGTWKKVNDGQPGGLVDGAYAANLEGRIVLFGGGFNCVQPSYVPYGMTWVYDTINNTWQQLEPAISPSARAEASMVYDNKVDKFVLFGGRNGSFFFNDTWTFDLKTQTWTNVTLGAHPRARSESAMVYDKGHDTILLYGGSWGTKNDDLWEYNITTNIWSTRKIGAAPGPQQNISMVYVDSINADVMNDEGSSVWIYRYATNDWVKTSGSFSYPWRDGTLVYDSYRDEVVMQRLTTWIYHPLTDKWEEFNPQPTPDAIQGYGMVYDLKTKKVLLHGGTNWDGGPLMDPILPLNTLWIFNPPSRIWAVKPVTPLNLFGARMVWDPDLNVPMIYGGIWGVIPWLYRVFADNGVYIYLSNDTYEQLPDKTGTKPSTPDYHAMSYDPVSKRLFVVGGEDLSLHPSPDPCFAPMKSYDTINTNWTNLNLIPTPSCRIFHSMVYDEATKKIVLFGGKDERKLPYTYMNDTWTYDPAVGNWQNMSPQNSPPARAYAGMVYVKSTKEILVFGGWNDTPSYEKNDLWAYNSTTNSWRNITQPGPHQRKNMGMTYDSKRDIVLVFGGDLGPDGLSNDLWAYDVVNKSWSHVQTGTGPDKRDYPEMVYDPVRDGFLIYGGNNARIWKCDTWLFKFDAPDRNGAYSSQPLDTNGTAYFGSISWNSTVPVDSSMRFQVRTGKNLSDLNSKTYLGPDGTTTTFYTVNNTRLNGVHNGSRFIQYKAYFHSTDWRNSPKLFNVKITYNLMHSVVVTRPKTGDILKGNANITWTGSDKDGDNLYYKVIVEAKSGQNWTIRDGTATTSVDPWDTLAYPNGSYRIRVIASDDNNMIPLSTSNVTGWFDIKNPPNGPPVVNLKSPLDGLLVDGNKTTLQWIGDDPDKDPLTYYLYIGKDRNNLMNEKPIHLADTKYDLVGNGTYYWTVVPNDGKVNGSCLSGIWKVVFVMNHAPTAWQENPKNAAVMNTKVAVLTWNGSDSDKDPLTFFVYLSDNFDKVLGREASAMILHTNKTTHTLNLNEGTYYWIVIPSDGKVNGTSGSGIWSFWVSIPSLYVTVGITNPGNHSVVSGMVNITGWANPAVGVSLVVVKVRIDGGQWTNAVGKKNWNFILNTKQLADGPHKIEAQAFGDQFRESKVVYIQVIVRNAIKHTSVESPLCLWLVLVAVAVSVGIVAGKFYYDNRKRPRSGQTSSTTNIK